MYRPRHKTVNLVSILGSWALVGALSDASTVDFELKPDDVTTVSKKTGHQARCRRYSHTAEGRAVDNLQLPWSSFGIAITRKVASDEEAYAFLVDATRLQRPRQEGNHTTQFRQHLTSYCLFISFNPRRQLTPGN